MDIMPVLQKAVTLKASDIFIVSGAVLSYKVGDMILPADDGVRLMPDDTAAFLREIYALAGKRDMELLQDTGDDDFSFSISHLGRFRCNAYMQRNSLAAVLRVVEFEIPCYQALGIPDTVVDLYRKKHGLVLITGPAGSGKSTTLACIVDKINRNRTGHIITIEDPIEYLHKHQKCIVTQREVGNDTDGYDSALRAAMRQSPNVILLGEMRDLKTTANAMTAAETGQLVLSTLHTTGASNTIDRVIDIFPSNQQQQIRLQLSMVLEAVVSQQLLPTIDGGVVPAFEILRINSAVRNMIRESKIHQLDNVIASGGSEGMTLMDADILRLYKKGVISEDTAMIYCINAESMQKKLES